MSLVPVSYGGRERPRVLISKLLNSISKVVKFHFHFVKFSFPFRNSVTCDTILLVTRLISMEVKEIVRDYFYSGYPYRIILGLLFMNHGIDISMSSLKRMLKKENLKRRPVVSDLLMRQTLAAIKVESVLSLDNRMLFVYYIY